VHSPTSLSRFTDATRQAETYRNGRVLLVGDAAHVHYPAGGQGIGLGIQDAMNLGWKLAAVVHSTAPDSLLDTYTAERHPADARALDLSMAQTVLQRTDPRTAALNRIIAELLTTDAGRAIVAARIHGLDLRYDPATPDAVHALVGRRMPDLELVAADGPTTVFAMLHEARAVLLAPSDATVWRDAAPWSDRLRSVATRLPTACTIPVVGDLDLPDAVLVRPDGHVAWTSADAAPLTAAIERWLGPA
jgi:3-(3-hydroxy-phenyl)propionate hydroxylase